MLCRFYVRVAERIFMTAAAGLALNSGEGGGRDESGPREQSEIIMFCYEEAVCERIWEDGIFHGKMLRCQAKIVSTSLCVPHNIGGPGPIRT